MLKYIAGFLAIGILIYAAITVFSNAGSMGDPVTSSANLDLKVKAQAGMAVKVAGASNRIRQTMAAGNDAAARQAMLTDLELLHQDVDNACAQLLQLGDSQAAIDHWLGIIRWEEFLALEQEFAKASTDK